MKVIKRGKGTRKCKKCGIIFEVYMHGNKYSHICEQCRNEMNREKYLKMRAAWGINRKLSSHETKGGGDSQTGNT